MATGLHINTNWHDIMERGLWTAVQAFAGSLTTATLAQTIAEVDISGLETIALSALGASVAAVLSFVKTIAQEKLAVTATRA